MSDDGSRPALRPRTASHSRPRRAPVARLARICANTRTIHPPCSSCWARRWARWCCWPRRSSSTASLTLQLQGKGLVNLLVAQCTHDFQACAPWRGTIAASAATRRRTSARSRAKARSSSPSRPPIARPATRAWCRSPATRWPNRSKRISVQSEQLPTRVLLAASAGVVAGMLVQRIPGEGGTQEQLDDAALECRVAEGRRRHVRRSRARQLLEDDVEQRLVDMFGVDEVRVFSGHDVKFECRCIARARRERAAFARRRRSALGDRGAGRVHRDLRVLPEALQVRRDRRRAAVRPAARRSGSDSIN